MFLLLFSTQSGKDNHRAAAFVLWNYLESFSHGLSADNVSFLKISMLYKWLSFQFAQIAFMSTTIDSLENTLLNW